MGIILSADREVTGYLHILAKSILARLQEESAEEEEEEGK